MQYTFTTYLCFYMILLLNDICGRLQGSVVLILGPNPNIKSSNNKKEKNDDLPFSLVERARCGKILKDDWIDDAANLSRDSPKGLTVGV